jgi:hypothetical protein
LLPLPCPNHRARRQPAAGVLHRALTLFRRVPDKIGQAPDKEVFVAFDHQKVAGRENVSLCSFRQPNDAMTCPEGLTLPAHLFERALASGQVAGRPPAFDFDRALSAVRKANQQIDIRLISLAS